MIVKVMTVIFLINVIISTITFLAPVVRFLATIHTSYQDGWITISIGDNGLGMTEAVRQKLFNAFFTTKPKGKGTGLGLSISY